MEIVVLEKAVVIAGRAEMLFSFAQILQLLANERNALLSSSSSLPGSWCAAVALEVVVCRVDVW